MFSRIFIFVLLIYSFHEFSFSVVSFAIFALLKNQLTAANVFTSVALFAMLTGPLNAFPWALNGLVESFVSLKRVDKFLKLSTFNDGLYYSDMNEIVDAEKVPNTVLGKIAKKNIIFWGEAKLKKS